MQIGTRRFGAPGPPYVIAEIGVNHDGDVARARELIAAAAAAGANAVKFQYFEATRLLSRSATLAQYQRDSGAGDPYTMLRRLELTLADLGELTKTARMCGLDSIVTVFSLEHVDRVSQCDWAAYKVASPDLINRPLIESLMGCDRPLILSTGASTCDEVARALTWLRSTTFALMHCVSAYPTPNPMAHLGGIRALQELAPVPVGYSDHTICEQTGGLAVAAGATILEKHLTYDRAAIGPDHAMSLEPDQLRRYIEFASSAAQMVGVPSKVLHDIERDVRVVARQSIVTTRRLRAGHVLRRTDLTLKRPGGGLEPAQLGQIVGRELTCDVEAEAPLTEGCLRQPLDHKAQSAIGSWGRYDPAV